MSLAKYLLIVAHEDDPTLDIRHIEPFLQHLLARIDWRRDLHFQTCTTIDTLDYSGSGFNEGSKVVMAAVGPTLRTLPSEISGDLSLPEGFDRPRMCLPGVLAIAAPAWQPAGVAPRGTKLSDFCAALHPEDPLNRFPLLVLVDDSEFTSRSLNNFLWVTFTRSNPASDIDGIGSSIVDKHWGCRGSLVIDARAKAHHAPPLVEDENVTRRVDALAVRGGPLHGLV